MTNNPFEKEMQGIDFSKMDPVIIKLGFYCMEHQEITRDYEKLVGKYLEIKAELDPLFKEAKQKAEALGATPAKALKYIQFSIAKKQAKGNCACLSNDLFGHAVHYYDEYEKLKEKEDKKSGTHSEYTYTPPTPEELEERKRKAEKEAEERRIAAEKAKQEAAEKKKMEQYQKKQQQAFGGMDDLFGMFDAPEETESQITIPLQDAAALQEMEENDEDL